MLNWERVRNLTVSGVLRMGRNSRPVQTMPDGSDAHLLREAMVSSGVSESITLERHEGKAVVLNGSGSQIDRTLPKATGSGARLRFIVGTVNTSNHRLLCRAGDVFRGQVFTRNSTTVTGYASTTNTILTLNGSTMGGQAIGDVVEVVDIAAGQWQALGHVSASGSTASPFSGS